MPYRVEYASTGRATCKGPQPCSGSKIEKNALRLGSLTEIQGHTAMAWRHWGWYVARANISTTERVLANMRKEIEDVKHDLDGFEDLEAADQEKVLAAFALGHVRDEDKTPALADIAASQEIKKQTQPRSRKRKVDEKKERDTTPLNNSDDEDEVERPDFLDKLPTKRTRRQTQRFGAEDTDIHARRMKRKVPVGKEEDEKEEEEEGEGEGEEEDDEDDEDEHDEDEDDSDDSDAFHASDAGDDDDDDDENDDD